MPTIRECALAYLNMVGQVPVPSRSTKYLVFNDPRGSDTVFMYVGKSGSIRIGSSITDSVPITNARKKYIVAMGTTILEGKS
jgi:hypothetical protein